MPKAGFKSYGASQIGIKVLTTDRPDVGLVIEPASTVVLMMRLTFTP